MSLTKKVYLTISGYDIKLSDNLTFYQKDQLKLIFYINEYGIDYENNATTRALMPVNPLNAILFIENPEGVDSVSSAKIEDNAVTFYLDSTHTQYVGVSRMQLRLFDQDGCAITLPHFTFEIRENIYGSGDVRFQNVVMVDHTGTVILTEDNDMLDVGDILTMGTEVAYPQVAKTIKDLPIKHGLDGTEKLIVEDNEATKQAPLTTIVDEIKQNSQEKIREIESELAQTNAQLSQTDQHLNSIAQIAIRIDGEVDDTLAIQRVIDSDNPLYVDRHLIVSDTIRLKLTSVILGKGKNSCSITMTNDNKWMFRLLTDKRDTSYDVVTSLKIHDVCLVGKNVLQINELTTTDFNKLGHIKGGSIERVLLKGKADNEIITSPIPTADELRVSGVGIQATKCFDMAIRDSEIERFGIGVDFLGCDINLIDNCRIAYCQRIYNGKRITTYGSQNKIKNCDLMHASKKGHIYLDGTRWDTIEDNYFECYSEQGMFITGKDLLGTTIINNRIDANGIQATPEIQLSPISQVSVINNRFNTGSVSAEIKILETNYQYYFRHSLSRVDGNTGSVKLTIPPMYNGSREKDYFNASNVCDINGQIAQSYPFELVDGLWKLKKSGNVIITLKPKFKSTNYRLAFNTYDTGGTYHVNVFKNEYGGTVIKQSPNNKGTDIVIANGHHDLEAFVIEFVAGSVDLESIHVINDYN